MKIQFHFLSKTERLYRYNMVSNKLSFINQQNYCKRHLIFQHPYLCFICKNLKTLILVIVFNAIIYSIICYDFKLVQCQNVEGVKGFQIDLNTIDLSRSLYEKNLISCTSWLLLNLGLLKISLGVVFQPLRDTILIFFLTLRGTPNL